MCVRKHAFLFVCVVPASFPEQMCVASCCTALSWLPASPQFGPVQGDASVLVTSHSFQVPYMAPGRSGLGCELAVAVSLPLLEVPRGELYCVYLLPSPEVWSRLWALWSSPQVAADPLRTQQDLTALHVFTPWPRAVFANWASQKQAFVTCSLHPSPFSRDSDIVWAPVWATARVVLAAFALVIIWMGAGQKGEIFQRCFAILFSCCRDFKANSSKCRLSSQKELLSGSLYFHLSKPQAGGP